MIKAGLILLFATFIGGALTPLFIKIGVTQMPPILFTFLRFLLASVILFPFYISQKGIKLPLKNFKLIFLTSIFFMLNVTLNGIGLQFTTTIMNQIIYSLTPVVVGLVTVYFLKENITKQKIIGSIIAFCGLSFLFSRSLFETSNTFGTPFGNILIFVAMLCWTGYLSFSRKLLKEHNAVTLNFIAFVITVLICFVLLPIEQLFRPFSINQIGILGLGSLLGVSIISSVLYFYLIQTGVKLSGAFAVSLIQYSSPLFTAITAVSFLGEKITLNLILGGILIIIGVFYATTYPSIRSK